MDHGCLPLMQGKEARSFSVSERDVNAGIAPYRDTQSVAAAATFTVAPPGFSSNNVLPFCDLPAGVKSINISPIAVISNFFIISPIASNKGAYSAFFPSGVQLCILCNSAI